jgi:hypothetical protein
MRKGKAKPSAAERFGEKRKSYMHAFTRRSPSSTSRQLFRLADVGNTTRYNMYTRASITL